MVSGRTHRRPGRSATFTVPTFTTVVMMATASAPSTLHPLYRERWNSRSPGSPSSSPCTSGGCSAPC
ncbi:hypothetical protein E4K10_24610 [Streptomyces sp. T1317-0309]|nr:hypothetical protein E4K10_24610 [Streptomyces sp. T1317-0309]